MKRIFIYTVVSLLFCCRLQAQDDLQNSAIKLYISSGSIYKDNQEISEQLQNRLYRKLTQLINATGIAEIGYSTFLVSPKLDILSVSKSNAGTELIYLAECELYISINRTKIGGEGGATFNSFIKSLMGSGSSKDEAITDALNKLSANDNAIVGFLTKSKEKINNYFKTHCDEVLKEADQALRLKQYEMAIALYFSVPSSAPAACYNTALNASEKVYKTYIKDDCNKKLIKLKSYVTFAQMPGDSAKKYYDMALQIIDELDPASDKCFDEANMEVEKIEKRFSEEQKRNWELKKKSAQDETEVKKEMYKAMGRISSNYQPPAPSNNVIIAN